MDKKNITGDDIKGTIINEKPCQIKQTQIISEGLDMKKVENTKYVRNRLGNKRESFLGLNKTIAWGYKGQYLQPILKPFRNGIIPSQKQIDKLLKLYPPRLFNFHYLEQYWI